MSGVTDRIKAAYKKMTDAEARIARDEKRHKDKIRKLENKAERVEAETKLKIETMKRRQAVAEAKATLRRAQTDQSLAGVALDEARQAHARSILGWGNVLKIKIKVKGPSAATKKKVGKTAKTVGKGALKFWQGLGKSALTPPPSKRATTKKKTTAKRKPTTTKKRSTTKRKTYGRK